MLEVNPFGEHKTPSADQLALLKAELQDLSGKFVEVTPGSMGHLVSTDSGYDKVSAPMKEAVQATRPGNLGVFIGSGGLLSLLPDLNIGLAVIVDKNPATTEFNRLLAEYAQSSKSAKEVLYRITSEEALEDSPQLRETINLHGGSGIMPALIPHLYMESRVYGDDHWTNPDRFELVQQQLGKVLCVSVVANIGREDFAEALSGTVRSRDVDISFANLTNVHNYLGNEQRSFASRWPFAKRPVVLLSGYYDSPPSQHPPMSVVTSIEEYTRLVLSDEIDFAALGR